METKLQEIQSKGITNVSPECFAGLCGELPYAMKQELYRKGYEDLLKSIQSEVRERIIRERLQISRKLSDEENEVASALLKQFELPGNTEIRIINAESYINGLPGLSEEVKAYYLSLRSQPKDLLDAFAKECSFEPPLLKDSIIQEVRSYIFKSPIFRDAIACHLARKKAELLTSDKMFKNGKRGNFTWGLVSECHAGTGTIKLSSDVLVANTAFGGSFAQLPNGQFLRVMKQGEILYHEGGHFRNMADLDQFPGIDDVVNGKFYLAFMAISIDEPAFHKWFDSVYAEGGDYAILWLRSLLLDHYYSKDEHAWKNKETFVEPPLEGIIKSAVWYPQDMEQIMGTIVLENQVKTYLFINTMSDSNLSAQLGLPVRKDHAGIMLDKMLRLSSGKKAVLDSSLSWAKNMWTRVGGINALNVQWFLPMQKNASNWIVPKHAETFVKFAPNLNAFGPLFELYGTSIYEYWGKMMYPYGLWSTLSFERRLYTEPTAESEK